MQIPLRIASVEFKITSSKYRKGQLKRSAYDNVGLKLEEQFLWVPAMIKLNGMYYNIYLGICGKTKSINKNK